MGNPHTPKQRVDISFKWKKSVFTQNITAMGSHTIYTHIYIYIFFFFLNMQLLVLKTHMGLESVQHFESQQGFRGGGSLS